MDFFTLTALGTAVGASGAAVITSLITSLRTKQKVVWTPKTKVELLFEQKELSRILIWETSQLSKAKHVPKEKIAELLNTLIVLYTSANLTALSEIQIKRCTDAADIALHMAPIIDRKYVFLFTRLVEVVVAAILRASGEKEEIRASMKTVESLKGITPAFRTYTGGEAQITEWKKGNS